jgi:hypothetical protein
MHAQHKLIAACQVIRDRKLVRGLNLDIDGWLRRIGLEQYAQTFRDNAIDADVLRDLTDDHLRELGLPLGARLKLLRAVATLGTVNNRPLLRRSRLPPHGPTPSVASSRS